MSNLKNKVVIITGSVGNLGQAVATRFSEEGARLALVDRSKERLTTTFPELAATESRLLLGGVDLNSSESVQGMAEKVLKRYDRIDALVHTVGAFRGGKTVWEEDAEVWTTLFSANVLTAVNACRAVAPIMVRQRRGAIINIGSRAALAGEANMAAYCAAKSAVARLTESLSAEVRGHGVNVNCVMPGTLDTPQNRQAMPSADTTAWVRLEDVAHVIAFLVSDAATAIHGALIPVFGRG